MLPSSSNSHPTQTRSPASRSPRSVINFLPAISDSKITSYLCVQNSKFPELHFVSHRAWPSTILDMPKSSCNRSARGNVFFSMAVCSSGAFLLTSNEQIHERREKGAPLPPPGYGVRKILQCYLWRDYFLKTFEWAQNQRLRAVTVWRVQLVGNSHKESIDFTIRFFDFV